MAGARVALFIALISADLVGGCSHDLDSVERPCSLDTDGDGRGDNGCDDDDDNDGVVDGQDVDPRELVATRPAKTERPIPEEQLVEAPPSFPTRPKRVWTWIAAGSTGALLGGGIFFAVRADRAFDDYRTTMDPARYDRLRDQIGRDDRIANVLFVGAGAAAVAAGIMFFVEARAAPGATRAPSIAVDLTGRGVAVRGRF